MYELASVLKVLKTCGRIKVNTGYSARQHREPCSRGNMKSCGIERWRRSAQDEEFRGGSWSS